MAPHVARANGDETLREQSIGEQREEGTAGNAVAPATGAGAPKTGNDADSCDHSQLRLHW
jgi:hypothetical protein